MSVSGKKEFDVKQILRLRWRWFSHPSQSSASPGGCLQQEGYEHRGTPVQARLKSHSRDRNGLKKNSSPLHRNILAPAPSPNPVAHQPIQTWQEQNLIAQLPVTEQTRKAGTQENCDGEEKSTQELQMITEENPDKSVERLSIVSCSSPTGVENNGSDEYFRSPNHAEQTFRKMENYLQQKQLCDVLLIAGDHRIPAHRIVTTASDVVDQPH